MFQRRTSTGRGILFVALAAGLLCMFTGMAAAQADIVPKSADEAVKKALVGKWKSDEAVIEFRSNGSIKINDDDYIFKVKGSVITVSNLEGSMRFPFKLDGDSLTVEVEGREVAYTRLKG